MKPSCSVSLLVCCLTVFFFNLVGADTPSFACDVDANPWVVNFTFCDQRVGTAERVADLVKRMNLYEKKGYMVNSAVAVPRLGIPKYQWWSEAVNEITHIGSGTRFSDVVPSATSFPKVILTVASFNTSLFEAIGKAVSTEARAMYNVGLTGLTFWTPDVNIARDPRFGRIRDTPGEDPVLAGKYATAYVKGLQETDDPKSDRLKVAACCKHYTAYDVYGGDRTDPSLFNAVVTQQDMEDTLLPPFKSCVVDGKVASVMCSYNQVNGKPACADPDLLSGLIRCQWNLNGYIVTDCDAIDVFHNFQRYTKTPEEAVALAIKSGVDLNCGNFIGRHSEVAVWTGLIEEADIDNAVTNNLATLMRLGFFDGDPRKQAYGNLGPEDVCSAGSQEIALEAARQGIVLLKNSPGSLPLSVSGIKSLAVIGPTANVTTSLTATPCKNFTPLQGLSAWVSTVYSPGCDDAPCGSAQLAEAAALAASADATVLIMGFDQHAEAGMLAGGVLTLPSHQNQLITAATDAAKGPVILVIMSAAGKDVRFAKDHPKVTSILWVGYPGEAGGTAIADVIFGAYNPSGRLPISWYPQSYADTVSMKDMNMRPDSNSGYPGRTYRFYTGDDFVYNFGDGLSYTNFHYQLIHAPNEVSVPLAESHECRFAVCVSLAADAQICRNLGFDLDLKVRNEGWMDGSHAVLLFSSPPSVHRSPRKHLVGFEKVYLGANTEAAVRMRVDVCVDLGVVDEFGARKVALGEHVLQIGDLKHSLNVRI